VSLSAHAGPGDFILLRFDFGVDDCNGFVGWYLDNVQVCTQFTPNNAPDLEDLLHLWWIGGDALDVQIFASDVDGDNLALSGIGMPTWATVLDFGDGTGRLQIRPTPADTGVHPVAVRATDDGTPPANDTSAFNVTILACTLPAPTLLPSITIANDLANLSTTDATTHRMVRGDIASLRSSGGDYSSATVDCGFDYMDTPAFSLLENPSPGEVVWYLVQGVTCGGRGTFDSGGAGQSGPRDAGIGAAAVGCSFVGCGDGYRNLNEACDGLDFLGETCQGQGYSGGTLSCSATCYTTFSGCF